MSQDKTNLEIVTELVEEIAEEKDSLDAPATGSKAPSVNGAEGVAGAKPHEKPKRNAPISSKEKPTLKNIAIKKKNQNLEERKTLLKILAALLGIQLIFMNAVVFLIVYWCVFDREIFNDLNSDVLTCIFDFTKFYVTAVLVELLGGIVYIVRSVFSDND